MLLTEVLLLLDAACSKLTMRKAFYFLRKQTTSKENNQKNVRSFEDAYVFYG